MIIVVIMPNAQTQTETNKSSPSGLGFWLGFVVNVVARPQ